MHRFALGLTLLAISNSLGFHGSVSWDVLDGSGTHASNTPVQDLDKGASAKGLPTRNVHTLAPLFIIIGTAEAPVTAAGTDGCVVQNLGFIQKGNTARVSESRVCPKQSLPFGLLLQLLDGLLAFGAPPPVCRKRHDHDLIGST